MRSWLWHHYTTPTHEASLLQALCLCTHSQVTAQHTATTGACSQTANTLLLLGLHHWHNNTGTQIKLILKQPNTPNWTTRRQHTPSTALYTPHLQIGTQYLDTHSLQWHHRRYGMQNRTAWSTHMPLAHGTTILLS